MRMPYEERDVIPYFGMYHPQLSHLSISPPNRSARAVDASPHLWLDGNGAHKPPGTLLQTAVALLSQLTLTFAGLNTGAIQ